MTTNEEEERFVVFGMMKTGNEKCGTYGVRDNNWNWLQGGIVFDCISRETAEELAKILNKADKESDSDKYIINRDKVIP